MSEGNHIDGWKEKTLYLLMGVAGVAFISTLILPVETEIAQFLAVLFFGIMTGLWLSHLIYNI